jgi:hypothetical protein
MLHIIFILTLILVILLLPKLRLLLPFSFSILHAILKDTRISVPISPLVLTKAIRVAISILPDVLITVGKEI